MSACPARHSTVGGSGLGPVERADDDESEAFALLAVDDDVARLRVRGGGGGAVGRLAVGGAVGVGEVASGGAVLRGHRARAAAILGARLACRGRQRAKNQANLLIPANFTVNRYKSGTFEL